MRTNYASSVLWGCLAALCLAAPVPGHGYTVSGSIHAYLNGGNGDTVVRARSEIDGPFWLTDSGAVGGNPQFAQASYFSNVHLALLGAYVHASDNDPDSYASGPGGFADAKLEDVITFTVPAGTYDDGVYASLSGYVAGNVEAVGAVAGLYSTCRAFGSFIFGSSGPSNIFSFDVTAKGIGPTSIVLEETFVLTTELVAPGQTVPGGGLTVERFVSASVETYGIALHTSGNPDVPPSTWITGDLYNKAGFTELTVPAFVEWTSESGVFLVDTTDSDTDGVADAFDNCLLLPNVNQVDADEDGIGNLCDPDLDQDCVISFGDLGRLKEVFFTADPVADFNSDGGVSFDDLAVMKAMFFQSPGPAADPNGCSE